MKNRPGSSFYAWVLRWKKPGKELREKFLVNTAVFITLTTFLFMVTGCYYYRSVTNIDNGTVNLLTKTVVRLYPDYLYPSDRYPMANLQTMLFMDYQVYLVNTGGIWRLTDAETVNDTIRAMAVLSLEIDTILAEIPAEGVSVKYKPKEERDLLKRIFIYADKVEFDQSGKACLAVNDISKIISLKDYAGPRTGLIVGCIGGALTVTLFILTIIALSDFSLEY